MSSCICWSPLPVKARFAKPTKGEGQVLSDAEVDEILLPKQQRKLFLRQGVPDSWRAEGDHMLRGAIWKKLTGASEMLVARPKQYDEVRTNTLDRDTYVCTRIRTCANPYELQPMQNSNKWPAARGLLQPV